MTRIRRPWWVAGQLALLAIAAWALATSVTSVVARRLSRETGAAAAATTRKAETAQVRPVTDYLAMARRDLFAAPGDESESLHVGGVLQRGPSNLKLLGTGGAGAAGYAIVEKKNGKEQIVLGIGEEIDGAKLKEVGWRRAILIRDGNEELLLVPADMAVEAARKTATRATGSVRDENIRELGDDRWMIAEAEVENQLNNLSNLFTQMRAVPNMTDGVADGFRIFAIRRNSLFQKLGLKNNDVVQRVNGMDLNDPARALGLLEELKGESQLSVDVLRGGEPRTLTYEIR
ncbi:MAG: type II secretion system protein GspC [Deltaproteobacteria bacterium]